MKIQQKKTSTARRIVWVILAIIILSSAGYLGYSSTKGDLVKTPANETIKVKPVTTTEPTVNTKSISETPSKIKIDAIGVDANIEPVGLTADGMMAAPDSNELVGWYDQSAQVGENKYAMLLDGHYGSDTEAAVFRRLSELSVGGVIEITGKAGGVQRYEVVENYQRKAEDVDMKKALYPYKEGVQSLTIITCEGLYDPVNVSYDKRTVVHAVLSE